jgi:hypothetical protein
MVGWLWFYPDKEMLMKITDHCTILERLDSKNVIVMKLALKGTSWLCKKVADDVVHIEDLF